MAGQVITGGEFADDVVEGEVDSSSLVLVAEAFVELADDLLGCGAVLLVDRPESDRRDWAQPVALPEVQLHAFAARDLHSHESHFRDIDRFLVRRGRQLWVDASEEVVTPG